jgi:hypothetical protein
MRWAYNHGHYCWLIVSGHCDRVDSVLCAVSNTGSGLWVEALANTAEEDAAVPRVLRHLECAQRGCELPYGGVVCG